jgi:hypothetical protein
LVEYAQAPLADPLTGRPVVRVPSRSPNERDGVLGTRAAFAREPSRPLSAKKRLFRLKTRLREARNLALHVPKGRDAADVPLTVTFGPSTLLNFVVTTEEAVD